MRYRSCCNWLGIFSDVSLFEVAKTAKQDCSATTLCCSVWGSVKKKKLEVGRGSSRATKKWQCMRPLLLHKQVKHDISQVAWPHRLAHTVHTHMHIPTHTGLSNIWSCSDALCVCYCSAFGWYSRNWQVHPTPETDINPDWERVRVRGKEESRMMSERKEKGLWRRGLTAVSYTHCSK